MWLQRSWTICPSASCTAKPLLIHHLNYRLLISLLDYSVGKVCLDFFSEVNVRCIFLAWSKGIWDSGSMQPLLSISLLLSLIMPVRSWKWPDCENDELRVILGHGKEWLIWGEPWGNSRHHTAKNSCRVQGKWIHQRIGFTYNMPLWELM